MVAHQERSRPFPWKCGHCRQRAVTQAVVSYATNVEHDGRVYCVEVPNLTVTRCEKCGEMVLDDAANQRISSLFRQQAGLLEPLEIRTNRERLALTQKQLALALGIAEATLSRWETGSQVQQRALDRLLRLYFGSTEVRSILSQDDRLTSLGFSATVPGG